MHFRLLSGITSAAAALGTGIGAHKLAGSLMGHHKKSNPIGIPGLGGGLAAGLGAAALGAAVMGHKPVRLKGCSYRILIN